MDYYVGFHPYSFGLYAAYHKVQGVRFIDIMLPLFILTIKIGGERNDEPA